MTQDNYAGSQFPIIFSLLLHILHILWQHSMMIPLSTRKSNQRGKLSIASQVANLGSTGLFATMLFPMLLYPLLKNQKAWLICMGTIGVIACLGIMLEFLFTRERVTEELNVKNEEKAGKTVSIKKQLKAVVSDRYWWMIILFYLFFNMGWLPLKIYP